MKLFVYDKGNNPHGERTHHHQVEFLADPDSVDLSLCVCTWEMRPTEGELLCTSSQGQMGQCDKQAHTAVVMAAAWCKSNQVAQKGPLQRHLSAMCRKLSKSWGSDDAYRSQPKVESN